MVINNRLKKITELINNNSFILDVGCDHALLDVYLSLNKNNIKCLGTDINEGPLLKAKDNIAKYKLNNICLKKCDGLELLSDDINYIVISGMGGILISNIILNDLDKINNQTLILSPNNDSDYLRKVLYKNKFKLVNELLVEDKHIYEILIYKKSIDKLTNKEIKYGKYLKNNYLHNKYYNKKLDELLLIKNKLPNKYVIKKFKINKKIRDIKSII